MSFDIRPGGRADLIPLTHLWHECKRAAYPYLPLEQARVLDEDRAFFAERILPLELWVAEDESGPVAFLALEDDCIDRLYVRLDRWRSGAGSALLEHAKAVRPEGFTLYTHQQNTAARAFYEAHGLEPVSYGISPPPESAPDVLYRWRP